jgi:cation diffusion facilitator CzcD-associated flavoprotein CzcO
MDEVSSEVRDLCSHLDCDQEGLARRYAYERDVRLRPEKNAQFIRTDKDFAHFSKDLYAPPLTRAPLAAHNQVIIIGGGIGGIMAAYHLREEGVTDVRIVEKAGDFGGTWYWNRYPGVRCDVESYVYMPLLEQYQFTPSEKYSAGAEILGHLLSIARELDLYRQGLLQTMVTRLTWDSQEAIWRVETDRGDKLTANFVIMANGVYGGPKLPGIPGIERFEGRMFHSSRWDYNYTGGGPDSPLVGLADKRVGVIGTGATGVQIIPEVGKSAEHLYVFQRTPAAVDYRRNRPTDPAWAAALSPGWQPHRVDNFHRVVGGMIEGPDLVQDGWTEVGKLQDTTASWAAKKIGRPLNAAEMEYALNALDDTKMNQLRARVDEEVKDRATAEALKPWHRRWCKRPCFSDEYLTTFNQPNVTLVDTAGKGIDQITAKGLIANGREYELDCLIFASGYEVGTELTYRAGFDVLGAEGQKLSEYWKDGMQSYLGLFIKGFPNLCILGFGQSALTFSVTFMLTEQSKHIAFVIGHAVKTGARVVEPTLQAVQDYVADIKPLSVNQRKFWLDCTPSYFTSEGDNKNPHGFFANIPQVPPVQFYADLETWRKEGHFTGLVFG